MIMVSTIYRDDRRLLVVVVFFLFQNTMPVKTVKARQIFDSRGNPTVEVDITTENGMLCI